MSVKSYIVESKEELVNKVTWPTRTELVNSAGIVMVASFIIALLIFAIDFTFGQVMENLYSLFF